MATTTNFGWETPDDTDLVKDGAAAIRTALGGVDTSFVDLKGGTTGQVLAKASNTDLDFVWSADAAGMTNPMTTTGDTIFSSSGSTPARRAIGTTGQVLTVSGGVPVWASPSAPAFVGCSLYKSANQTINDSTYTAATFDLELFDTDSFHDNVTNNARITIPAGRAGKYLLVATADITANSTGIRQVGFWKNATIQRSQVAVSATSAGESKITVSGIFDLAVSDYVEFRVYQNSGASRNLLTDSTVFSCQFLGA
jgi:hypothetical protein